MNRTITLPPSLTAQTTTNAWNSAMVVLGAHPAEPVTVDASALNDADETGLSLLFTLTHSPRTAGAEIRFEALAPRFVQLIDHFDPQLITPPAASAPLGFVASLGQSVSQELSQLAAGTTFIGRCVASMARGLRQPRSLRAREILAVATEAGANAVPIVCLIGFLMGVIIAFQSALVAQQFGAVIYVVNGVGVAMLRELGPLMTAVVFAGRTGAAFAARLGTQKVNEEINALTTFGLDPIDFLVRPRLIAALLVVPLLAVLADLIGVLGGALVMLSFDISFAQFYSQLIRAIDLGDFLIGLVKAAVFGVVVATIGCEQGLGTGAGASAVGTSTTRAVVAGIVWIVVIDGVFAVLLSRWNL
ncbi:MAG: ABC transporter permease [Burkholderiaceae bacterium]